MMNRMVVAGVLVASLLVAAGCDRDGGGSKGDAPVQPLVGPTVPAPTPEEIEAARQACAEKGAEWAFSAYDHCIRVPVISVVSGSLVQAIKPGEQFAPIVIADVEGRTLTWDRDQVSVEDNPFDRGPAVVTVKRSSFGEGSRNVVEIRGSYEGIQSNTLVAELSELSRPTLTPISLRDEELQQLTLGQGDYISLRLAYSGGPDDYFGTLTLQDETCPGVLSLRDIGQTTRLEATTRFDTAPGTCKATLQSERGGLISKESLPIVVTVQPGKRFYGYCTSGENSPSIANTVAALRRKYVESQQESCESVSQSIHAEDWLRVTAASSGEPLDLSPLAGAKLRGLTIENGSIQAVPQDLRLGYLTVKGSRLPDLAGFLATEPHTLRLTENTFERPAATVQQIESMTYLRTLELAYGYQCVGRNSGLNALPAIEKMPKLTTFHSCDAFAFDFVLSPEQGRDLALESLALENARIGRLDFVLPQLASLSLKNSSVAAFNRAGIARIQGLVLSVSGDLPRFDDLPQLKKLELYVDERTSLRELELPKDLEALKIEGGIDLATEKVTLPGLSQLSLSKLKFSPQATLTGILAAMGSAENPSNLETLNLNETGIAQGDTALGEAAFPKLSMIYVEKNELTGLEWIVRVQAVETLGVSGNRIQDLSPLASLSKLSSLWASADEERAERIVDVTPLSGLKDLSFVVLDNQGMTNVAPLASLEKLSYLSLIGAAVERTEAACPTQNVSSALAGACRR